MTTWKCITNCGACCYLNPNERPPLEEMLTSEEIETYLSIVGEDGWCIHYDEETRRCNIYETRPSFCRVTPDNFTRMFDIPKEEFDEFAIDCCQQQIEDLYGEESPEMDSFLEAIDQ